MSSYNILIEHTMKKYILLVLVIILTTGCSNSYSKHREVEESYNASEPQYTIWIISQEGGVGLGKVTWNKVGSLPISQVNQHAVDSMDRIADIYILKLKEIEKEIKNR